MRAVLNETLRLFSPVPLNVRECRETPTVLPVPSQHLFGDTAARGNDNIQIPTPTEPMYMPGNTVIMYFPMLMMRNPDLWGDDADEFIPERWLDPARISRLTANPLMFTPFSAGPRIVSVERRPNLT